MKTIAVTTISETISVLRKLDTVIGLSESLILN